MTSASSYISAADPALDAATATVLQRSAAVWPQLPRGWNDGAFTGNGNLGTIVWQDGEGRLRCEVSRMDLYDHRGPGQAGGMLFRHYRLPNGHLALRWGETAVSGSLRLDLARAEIAGRLSGQPGDLELAIRTHAVRPVIQIDTQGPPQGPAPEWSWQADPTKSPRTRKVPAALAAYPPAVRRQVGTISVSVQDMPEDAATGTIGAGVGQYATAWAQPRSASAIRPTSAAASPATTAALRACGGGEATAGRHG